MSTPGNASNCSHDPSTSQPIPESTVLLEFFAGDDRVSRLDTTGLGPDIITDSLQ
jgi:hypothetical protein